METDKDTCSTQAIPTAEISLSRMPSNVPSQSAFGNSRSSVPVESYLWKKFISLDGECHLYTTVVLICMSLALLIFFFERGLLKDRDDDRYYIDLDQLGVAERRLLRSLLLLLAAVLNGVIAFLLLGVNLRDLQKMPYSVSIRWLFLSAFGFIVGNLAAVGVVLSAQSSFQYRRDRDSYEKPFPHYFLLGVFAFFMWVMDILYIREIYLPFFEAKPKGWDLVRRNIPAMLKIHRKKTGKMRFIQRVHLCMSGLVNSFVRFVNYCIYIVFHLSERVVQWWIRVYKDETSFGFLKMVSRGISFIALLPFQFIRWSLISQIPRWITKTTCRLSRKLLRSLFRPLIQFARVSRIEGINSEAPWSYRLFRGFLIFQERFLSTFTQFKPGLQKAANDLWDDIKEDEEYKHSSWLKASVITSSILLIYFGLKMVNHFHGYMDDVFIGFSPSNSSGGAEGVEEVDQICSVAYFTGQEQTTTQVPVEEALGNLTRGQDVSLDNFQNPYYQFSRQLDIRVQQNLEQDRLYKCEDGVRHDDVCVLLSAVNLAEETLRNNQTTNQEPSDEFFDSFTGEVVYVFDVYMRNLDWAVWVGLVAGLLFGFWTLLSVMGQYKRLSLAIRAGLFQDFEVGETTKLSSSTSQKRIFLKRVDSVIDNRSFTELILQYPMSVSVLFSGMLISTAVLQLVVFGGLVASAISLIASLSDSEVLKIVSPLLWTLLAFFITWLVNGPIATTVIGEGLLVSHFQVIHEICFFLFLLVLTSVHLVVGVFLAFFRMLWVLLTSLVTINRLDKNLFAVCRDRDLGHKSFMALVFMQHVFHVNRSGDQYQRSHWNVVLRQVESSVAQIELERTLQRGSTINNQTRSLEAVIEEDELCENPTEVGRSLLQDHQHSSRLHPLVHERSIGMEGNAFRSMDTRPSDHDNQ
eukprot:g4942.t1